MEKLGPTGQRLGRRLKELRRERDLTLSGLETRLTEVGRPILLSALSKIEMGQRRVDVDDLVALALALDVSPNLLLLPDPDESGTAVRLTRSTSRDAGDVWRWAVKDRPPPTFNRGIFVSYSHRDSTWATWVAWCLARAGYEVAFDSWDLAPGSGIESYVVERVSQAACVVVIISDNYERSKWAQFEVALAVDKNLPVLPVVIDGSGSVGDNLDRRPFIDLSTDSEVAASKKLLNAVHKLGIRSRPTERPPTFPSRATEVVPQLQQPRQRTIVVCDVEGSTTRTNPTKAAIRADTLDLLETALLRCKITDDLHEPLIKTGDGVMTLVRPDGVPKSLLLHTFVPALSELLAEHATVHPDRMFRLRVAIHSGDVHFDRQGVFGEDIDLTFRLLDAPELKQRLQKTHAPLVLAVSDHIHRSIIRHGYDGIDGSTFDPSISVEMAGQRHTGWIQVPGESMVSRDVPRIG